MSYFLFHYFCPHSSHNHNTSHTVNMKHTALLTTLFCGLLFAFCLPLPAQNTLQHQKDSMRCVIDTAQGLNKLKAYRKLYYLYMAEVADDNKMDTLVSIFGEAEHEAIRQGNPKMQGMIYANAIICYMNRNEYDKVIEIAPAYLDFFIEHEQWAFYNQIHMQLINAYSFSEDYEQAAREADIMYQRAKERKDKTGMATALYATGTTYHIQDRWAEEEKCFRECISLLWESKGYDNVLTQAYAYLCSALRTQRHYEELLKLIPEYEKAIARFEKASGRQQPEAHGNLYLVLMNTYTDLKQYDKAEPYIFKLEGIVNNSISQFEILRAKALIGSSRGDYRNAIAAIDSAMTYIQESSFNLINARKIKMEILARAGRNDEAFALLDDIIADNDSLKNVEVNARFDELRTQYEVEKHIAEKERNFHYFLFAGGLSAVLVLLLAGVFYYNRQISAKNRKLYERIKEQDRLTDNLFRIAQTIEATSQAEVPDEALPDDSYADDSSSDDSDDSSSAAPVCCDPATINEYYLLVARLRKYLLSEDRLTCAEINRDEIITALGTNRKKLNNAVRAVAGKSTMEYLRLLKIEEARKKLDLHPELTLEAITYICGFNNPSTFYRLFRKQYDITPAEYRKQALLQKK